jgi:hypothetical protein
MTLDFVHRLFQGCVRWSEAMATMIAEVYDALMSAGAPEEKARRAAEAVANYENRFGKIETDLTLLKWMVGFNLAMTAGVIAKLFSVG